jgi:signal transduction histidine kinase
MMERLDSQEEDSTAQLARQAVQRDVPEAISFIRSSTQKMDRLINAILKLSREGRRTLKPESLDLEKLLQASAASVAHQVAADGGELTIDCRVPRITSDRIALEQVFGNLLDNAVKYKSSARTLRINIRAKFESAQYIAVEIEDNGRGIAPEDRERVFDLFRRSGPQDRPGEGIGLAHVRTVVRSLGGEISLKSELDRGTAFILSIPADLRKVIGASSRG